MKRKTPIIFAAALTGVWLVAIAVAQDTKPGTEEWVAPARAAKKKNPIESDAASLEKGKALYVKECASCHGDKGKGDGPAVKDLEKKPADITTKKTMDQSDGAFFWKLTEGRKPMPSYEKTFTEEERWHVINYMRTLASKAEK